VLAGRVVAVAAGDVAWWWDGLLRSWLPQQPEVMVALSWLPQQLEYDTRQQDLQAIVGHVALEIRRACWFARQHGAGGTRAARWRLLAAAGTARVPCPT
jgi:hypothetical protein